MGGCEHKVKVGKNFINRMEAFYWFARLESVVYPLFTEPTHMVVFDIAFKRETYFDGSFGVLVKVEKKFLFYKDKWYFIFQGTNSTEL